MEDDSTSTYSKEWSTTQPFNYLQILLLSTINKFFGMILNSDSLISQTVQVNPRLTVWSSRKHTFFTSVVVLCSHMERRPSLHWILLRHSYSHCCSKLWTSIFFFHLMLSSMPSFLPLHNVFNFFHRLPLLFNFVQAFIDILMNIFPN